MGLILVIRWMFSLTKCEVAYVFDLNLLKKIYDACSMTSGCEKSRMASTVPSMVVKSLLSVMRDSIRAFIAVSLNFSCSLHFGRQANT